MELRFHFIVKFSKFIASIKSKRDLFVWILASPLSKSIDV